MIFVFRILAIDPTHVQGQHNLCVVYVERGLLLEVRILKDQDRF